MFVYNAGGTLVAEYSTALATTQQVSYLTQDHLGSPRVITNENGAVTDRKDYSAFGEETASSQRISNLGYTNADELRKGYTGYEKDSESGLEFAQARYYNSIHGRFTSVDPLTASASIRNPQTFNRYSYVLNSPYKFVDPLGLISSSTGACGQWCQNYDQSGWNGGIPFDSMEPRDATKLQKARPPDLPPHHARASSGHNKKQPAAEHSAAPPAAAAQTKDIFDTGLAPIKKTGPSTPTRAVIIDKESKEVNTPTTVSLSVTYQVTDQYGRPYTGPGAGGSEVSTVYEEVVELPSVCDIEGCEKRAKTGFEDLDSNGRFHDYLAETTGISGIRIPDNTSIRSLQRIYIDDIVTGKKIDIRLNLVEITRTGVKITDISETGTKVPRK